MDQTYPPDDVALMEGDLLAVCKVYAVNSDTVTNICADDFRSTFKVSLVSTEEDLHDFLECSSGKANKIALRHVLKRIKAGNLRSEIPAPGAPPAKKAKKSLVASDVPSGSGSGIPADELDEDEAPELQDSAFEKSEVTLGLTRWWHLITAVNQRQAF